MIADLVSSRQIAVAAHFGLDLLTRSRDEPDPTGSWRLDSTEFADTLTAQLIGAGKVPNDAETMLKCGLRTVVLDLELLPDQTFEGVQRLRREQHAYRGRWRTVGRDLHLDQTHKDGEPDETRMKGVLAGDSILCEERQRGVDVRMRLVRAAAARWSAWPSRKVILQPTRSAAR